MTQSYLYKWVEKSTGKWYVGSRTALNCHPDDGYICSSKYVKPMILSNPEDWYREILALGDPTSIRKKEADYLNLHNAVLNPMSYNRHNAIKEFHHMTQHTEETKSKISKKLKGRQAVNKGVPHTDESKAKMKGRTSWCKGIKTGIKSFTGKTHSPESKQKMSEAQKLIWARRRVAGV